MWFKLYHSKLTRVGLVVGDLDSFQKVVGTNLLVAIVHQKNYYTLLDSFHPLNVDVC